MNVRMTFFTGAAMLNICDVLWLRYCSDTKELLFCDTRPFYSYLLSDLPCE